MIKRYNANIEGVSVRIDGKPVYWAKIPKNREVVIPLHVIDEWAQQHSLIAIRAPSNVHVMIEAWKSKQ